MPCFSRRPVSGALFAGILVGVSLAHVAGARPADSPPVPGLPPPGPSVFRLPKLVPWPADRGPVAPAGFSVSAYARGLEHPRALCVLPNGDVLVSQGRTERMGGMPPEVLRVLTEQGVFGPSPDNVILLRREAGRVSQYTLVENLNQPFGLLFRSGYLYVANTDAVVRYRFEPGATRIEGAPETVIRIPVGESNNHWTRNLLAVPESDRLLLAVGSGTNVNEDGTEPPERAAIWEIAADGSDRRLLATGLRNPVGLDFEPTTGALWVTVNERDGLGENVPPDYLTRVVPGAFYGWPYVYFGDYPDPTQLRRDPGAVARARETARVPDLALGAHSVPLGLAFYRGRAFPERYRGGAFIARRGGGSRVEYQGFDLVFVPFAGGQPTGAIEPFVTGFIVDQAAGTVAGRPVGMVELADGSLLFSDDAGGVVWQVRYDGD